MSRKSATKRGYDRNWQKTRILFLSQNPLCVFCKKENRTTIASVVDHIVPHKGCRKLFWDKNNWQSLCRFCHNSTKKRMENNGAIRKVIGDDGYPIGDM